MNLNIYETKFWNIELSTEQYYLGRCYIVLKRECQELSSLTEEEFSDLLVIIKDLEKALKKAFGANMFNWTCMMNDAWKDTNDRKPQVHFHMRPRYKDKVEINGTIFEDKEFAHHYIRKIEKDISEEVTQEIIKKIQEALG
jgi:diadenosine tetraphosphate (Ap4A) HIT family hydrolase